MNEYNERVLKTVLQDYRVENDEELINEIEEAKNDPLFQVSDEEAKAFAEKYVKKSQKKNRKLFLKVASVIFAILFVGVALIPINVEGKRNTIAQHLVYYISSEFLSFGTDADSSLLLSYEGEFIPSYIPEGYHVESVNNSKGFNEIVLKNNNDDIIVLSEHVSNLNDNIDHQNGIEIENISILGYQGIYYRKEEKQYIVVFADDIVLNIMCNNDDTDLLAFTDLIEKR